MLIAILIYAVYTNLMSASQAWVAQGRISFAVGLVSVHLVMLIALPLMFARRILVFSFLRMQR